MAKRQRQDSLLTTVQETVPASPLLQKSPSPNAHKHRNIESSSPSSSSVPTQSFYCALPPHPLFAGPIRFSTYAAYETHYIQQHTNRCADCGRNFPSTRFLEVHILDTHDALVAVKRSRGEKTYACLVEGCERLCSTPQKRRMHLIDKHMFPKSYNFNIINTGLDSQSSMLKSTSSLSAAASSHASIASSDPGSPHRRRVSLSQAPTAAPTAKTTSQQEQVQERWRRHDSEQVMDTDAVAGTNGQGPEDKSARVETKHADIDAVDALAQSMASLRFVPHSVRIKQQQQKR